VLDIGCDFGPFIYGPVFLFWKVSVQSALSVVTLWGNKCTGFCA